jgi:hypothetical protein
MHDISSASTDAAIENFKQILKLVGIPPFTPLASFPIVTGVRAI